MGKLFKYAFFTCTLAYLIAAILLVIFFAIEGISVDYIVRDLLTGLTLVLSEFSWWGAFYYLSFLVPWLASSLVLVLLIYGFNGGARRRQLLGGLSICVYYIAMILVFAIGRLVTLWGQIEVHPGDIGYLLLLIWPVCGFGLGYLASIIVERVLKPQFAD